MVKNALKGLSLFLAAFLLQRVAFAAEVVELPPEELAQESVYPVFDKPVSVKNRNVLMSGKFEIGGYYGNALTEPIFNVSKFGLAAYYHTSEIHAIGFFYEKNAAGLSKYGEQLREVPSSDGTIINLDFNRAPAPDSTMMVDYNFNAFYGKMSLSKSIVFNLTTLGSVAGGMVKYANKAYPGIALGLGQKYYLTRALSLRVDVRLFMNNAPIPFYKTDGTTSINPSTPGKTAPTFDQFKERLTYTTNMDFGLNYMF
jgi:outer membrane beta-barrel protein